MPNVLSGYKTYIAGGILILTGLYHIATTGTVDLMAIQTLATGLGFVGIRHSISEEIE